MAVTDRLARAAAYMTLDGVCFQPAFRNQSLSLDLGGPPAIRQVDPGGTTIRRGSYAKKAK